MLMRSESGTVIKSFLAPYNGLLGVSIISYKAKTTGETDAIKDMPTTDNLPATPLAAIYNLQGQRLHIPQRGVNIVGRTKTIVK